MKKIDRSSLCKKAVACLSAMVMLAMPAGTMAEEAGSSKAATGSALEVALQPYNGLNPDTVVLTVGDEEVSLRKAYFLVKLQQAIAPAWYVSQYGEEWYTMPVFQGGRSYEDEAKDYLIELVKMMSLARQQKDELGISLSKDEKAAIKDVVDTFMASNSQEALDVMMADEETVTEILTDYTILNKVVTQITRETEVDYGEAKTYSYTYCSVESGTEDTEEQIAGAKKAFQELYEETLAGGEFDTLASEKGYPSSMHTYLLNYEEDVLNFFNETMDKLQPGEVSQVTYTEDGTGMFIGYMEEEVDEKGKQEVMESMLQNARVKDLKKELKNWKSDTKITLDTGVWSRVKMGDPLSTYTASTEETSETAE